MEKETIQVKCPNDGTLLMVKNRPGLERMSLTCPVCKQKMPFSKMLLVNDKPREEKGTSYPEQNQVAPAQAPVSAPGFPQMNTGMATPPPFKGTTPAMGYLIVRQTGARYPLRVGTNIIGRQAANSTANIQLPASPMRRMSREHIRIDTQPYGAGMRFLCSLYKPDVNATYINGVPLQFGNYFVLQPGMTIVLPDCELIFSLQ